MNYSQAAIALELEEGRVRHAYQDSEHFWTIGVGHLIDERGGGLSDRIIDIILADDIGEKWSQVMAALPWVMTLSEPRQFVFLSMAFQLGIHGLLGFHDFLTAARAGDVAAAADHMLDSDWARIQTPGRARRLSDQYRTNTWVLKQQTKEA